MSMKRGFLSDLWRSIIVREGATPVTSLDPLARGGIAFEIAVTPWVGNVSFSRHLN